MYQGFLFLVRFFTSLPTENQKIYLTLLQRHNFVSVFYTELLMSQKIYVGNLGYNVSESTLSDKFAEFGTVNSAKVIIDRDTNRSKGFGFVEMSSSTEASRAISGLNGMELDGRQMNVSEAKEVAPRTRSNNRW